MAENIVTNANDVDLFMESGTSVSFSGGDSGTGSSSQPLGTSADYGRLVVDNFTITREEDDSIVSGVGFTFPAGLTTGDITLSFDFTMQGSDAAIFDMIADSDGKSQIFSLTARKTDSDGETEWEFALNTCKATSEEVAATSGDPLEYNIEGVAMRMERLQQKL